MRRLSVLRLLVLAAFAAHASSEFTAGAPRTLHRLVGGHYRIRPAESDDTELIAASAGAGRDGKKHKGNDEEDRKTLSQQVADGKYGLIQKELFSKPVKRPGVISYESNAEVPKDNAQNLGGLEKNEIWLAENHLLVLRGGSLPPHETQTDQPPLLWPAIDNFVAPNRQVKIPSHPKVPPPFPVQLTQNGPLQFLGTNSSRTVNVTDGGAPYPLLHPEAYIPGGQFLPPPYQYPANATSGETPFPIAAYPPAVPGDFPQGDGIPPFPFPLNGTWPPYFASLPPGAAILPPPNNLTDQYDEDDPSIYYPPPYSFFYPKDNSTEVPPGPLVPGIILPPPPDFFAPLEESKAKISTTTDTQRQIQPTTTPLPPTPVLDNIPYRIPEDDTSNEVKPPTKIYRPVVNRTTPRKPMTAIKTTIPPIYESKVVSGQPFALYEPPTRGRTVIQTTKVPLKSYYTSTNDISVNSVTPPPKVQYYSKGGISTVQVPKTKIKPPAQYFFYEEDKVTTPVGAKQGKQYFNIPEEYYVPAKQVNINYRGSPVQQEPQYFYVTKRPQTTTKTYQYIRTNKPNTFSIHIARLQQQLHSYYTTPNPYDDPIRQQRIQSSPRPVYQYSFQAANYPQSNFRAPHIEEQDPQDKFRPLPRYSVQIQPAIEVTTQNTPSPVLYYQPNTERPARYRTTQRPPYEYQDNRYAATPRPITQYSFEATSNPLYDSYFTKQDERFVDDRTKKYFTTFGQKLPASTTEIPRPPQYQPLYKPVSLEGDTLVNYVKPRPPINPDAEIISIGNQQPYKYQQPQKYMAEPVRYVQPQGRPLHRDVDVNYKQHRPRINSNAELVKAISASVSDNTGEGSPGAYISYQLPGDDGAHFYFLTPQLAQRRNQGVGYYYTKPNTARIRRSNLTAKR